MNFSQESGSNASRGRERENETRGWVRGWERGWNNSMSPKPRLNRSRRSCRSRSDDNLYISGGGGGIIRVVSCNYRGNGCCNVSGSDRSKLPWDITHDIAVSMDDSGHHIGHLNVPMQESTVSRTVMSRRHSSVVVKIAGSRVRLLESEYHLLAVGS